jgi:DNA-directed RNA polymerase sigma subunit (sigma70/sigma32)
MRSRDGNPADTLEQTLSSLETSEALVLRLRTGLVDGRPHSLREIGEFLGTTKAEARSLEYSGWRKLERMARDNSGSRDAVRFLLGRCAGSVGPRTVN